MIIEPRYYQAEAQAAVLRDFDSGIRKTLLSMATGTGKTIVFALLAEALIRRGERILVLAHREELLNQAQDKINIATGLGCAVEKAEKTAIDEWYRITVGSVQTLMRPARLEQFPRDYYDTIIIDEAHHCCPAGTMIDGTQIEKLSIGDFVSTYNHKTKTVEKQRITAIMTNPASVIYELFLSDGSTLCCTGNHPLWNGADYAPASSFRVGNVLWRITNNERISKTHKTQNMFDLRNSIYSNIMELENDSVMLSGVQGSCKGKQTKESNSNLSNMSKRIYHSRKKTFSDYIGKNFLFKRVQRKIKIGIKLDNDGRNKSKICFGAHEKKQSNEKRRCSNENEKGINGASLSSQDGKRTIHKASNSFIQCIKNTLFGILCVGISHKDSRSKDRSSYSKLLQDGHCLPGTMFSNRDRWEESQNNAGKKCRQVKNKCLTPVRVERIEIHKSASRRKFNRLCPDGNVYNIEVEKNNNYFANGILVHNCLADSYRRILAHFDKAKVLGVTATPDRGDMRNLGEVYESLAYEYPLIRAINDKYLCPIKAQTIPLNIDLNGIKTQAGDFKLGELDDALTPYLTAIADEMVAYCKDRKTVVFLPLIATSQKMQGILNDRGFRCGEVNHNSPDRAKILQDFTAGHYDVLCNSMLLTEGWDEPSADCIVCLRPTKVRSLYAQIIGRGTRLFPGKDHLLLLDFLWHSERHSLCRPANLVCDNQDLADKITEILARQENAAGRDLQEIIESGQSEVVAEREKQLAKKLAEQKARKRALVDPLQFGMSIRAEDIADYSPAFGSEMAPPSKAQIKMLEKAGICPDEVENAGMASKLIDRVQARRDAGLTTPKQIRFLERVGFQHVGTWEFDSAKKLIDRIAVNRWRIPPGIIPEEYQPKGIA